MKNYECEETRKMAEAIEKENELVKDEPLDVQLAVKNRHIELLLDLSDHLRKCFNVIGESVKDLYDHAVRNKEVE